MSIVVYHLNPDNTPGAAFFSSTELGAALKLCEELRKLGARHVSISSESNDSIGAAGVASVENGKTPDGLDYEWSKKHRGDGPRS